MHSSFSYDADRENTLEVIVDTAVGRGIAGIAVTDHFDPLWPDEKEASVLDVPAYEAALFLAETAAAGRIRFAKGIELGLIPGEALEICEKTVSAYPYDFVIAAIHSSAAAPVDYPAFLEGRPLKALLEEYYTLMLDSVRAYKNYDVIGHINNIDRYTGSLPGPELYMPYIDEVLRVVVEDGKGLEVNTSAFRRGIGDHGTPTQSTLNRFRELGGEIVTIGSDAHRAADIGAYIEKGEEMLLAAGFEYFTVFSGRRPGFFKL